MQGSDLGVAPDFLGNVFWHVLPLMHGRNQAQRISSLFEKIQQYYKDEGVQSQLPTLTKEMIWKQHAAGPKLRAKASESKALVKFARGLCNECLDDSPLNLAVKTCANLLAECYDCLREDSFEQPKLGNAARKFNLQYVALSRITADSLFRFKPKHHVWQHLCEETKSCPTLFWTYRDEDFGGTLASLTRQRGGANTPLGVSTTVLQKFMQKHSLVQLR